MAPDGRTPTIQDDADERRRMSQWAAAIIFAAALIVFVAGATSDVVKGDEAYYSMFAEAWHDAGLGNRPVYNPHYPSGEAGYYYTTEPLWPLLCSLVWHVTGVHAWSAQLFQASLYALLLAMIYRLGRDVLGPRGALVALLAAVSVPMFGAFSILLYTDVPVTVLLILAVVLLRKEQFLAAGVMMGLAYLTKRNAAFLAPGFVLWLLWTPGTVWERVRRVGVFVLAAGAVTLPDFLWRQVHIPLAYEPVSMYQIVQRLVTRFSRHVPSEAFVVGVGGSGAPEAGSAAGWWDRLGVLFALRPGPSRINHPGSVLQYVGVLVPACVALYVGRRVWQRGDGWLWILAAVYTGALLSQVPWDAEVRYTMPAAALLIVPAARALEGWWRKGWVLALVGVVAFAHLGAAGWAVHDRRHLTSSQRAVFEYLRTETPADARVLYPGEALVAQAKRQAVWSQLRDPETGVACITGFLQEQCPQRVEAILNYNAVDYICVDWTQVYRDGAQVVAFGCPESFVKRLPTLPFLEKVSGDWPGMELWKVKRGPPVGEGDTESPLENAPASGPR